ncbi:hypothetical protein BT63DRAFT_25717 [Microthyrium microscopicum]|uniref:Uncharacterized protein n=1 Tax=Microthyrium microscopicum TaxID=703497 RepID=A0A6A6URS1_9PEZI|nr:hypothetical protein BT63DRAFT_25717 [Microthyrium microscopicum]
MNLGIATAALLTICTGTYRKPHTGDEFEMDPNWRGDDFKKWEDIPDLVFKTDPSIDINTPIKRAGKVDPVQGAMPVWDDIPDLEFKTGDSINDSSKPSSHAPYPAVQSFQTAERISIPIFPQPPQQAFIRPDTPPEGIAGPSVLQPRRPSIPPPLNFSHPSRTPSTTRARGPIPPMPSFNNEILAETPITPHYPRTKSYPVSFSTSPSLSPGPFSDYSEGEADMAMMQRAALVRIADARRESTSVSAASPAASLGGNSIWGIAEALEGSPPATPQRKAGR